MILNYGLTFNSHLAKIQLIQTSAHKPLSTSLCSYDFCFSSKEHSPGADSDTFKLLSFKSVPPRIQYDESLFNETSKIRIIFRFIIVYGQRKVYNINSLYKLIYLILYVIPLKLFLFPLNQSLPDYPLVSIPVSLTPPGDGFNYTCFGTVLNTCLSAVFTVLTNSYFRSRVG